MKVTRRQFTAEYRRRVLKEVDACRKPGELGALLRREGPVQLALESSGVGIVSKASWARGVARHA